MYGISKTIEQYKACKILGNKIRTDQNMKGKTDFFKHIRTWNIYLQAVLLRKLWCTLKNEGKHPQKRKTVVKETVELNQESREKTLQHDNWVESF